MLTVFVQDSVRVVHITRTGVDRVFATGLKVEVDLIPQCHEILELRMAFGIELNIHVVDFVQSNITHKLLVSLSFNDLVLLEIVLEFEQTSLRVMVVVLYVQGQFGVLDAHETLLVE